MSVTQKEKRISPNTVWKNGGQYHCWIQLIKLFLLVLPSGSRQCCQTLYTRSKMVLWKENKILLKIFDCYMMYCCILKQNKYQVFCLWWILRKGSLVFHGHLSRRSWVFFNFGPNIKQWIKTFRKNANVCAQVNGQYSRWFSERRGVKQGDSLSAYLYLICTEILWIMIREKWQK